VVADEQIHQQKGETNLRQPDIGNYMSFLNCYARFYAPRFLFIVSIVMLQRFHMVKMAFEQFTAAPDKLTHKDKE
jgi:hypothetical protein